MSSFTAICSFEEKLQAFQFWQKHENEAPSARLSFFIPMS